MVVVKKNIYWRPIFLPILLLVTFLVLFFFYKRQAINQFICGNSSLKANNAIQREAKATAETKLDKTFEFSTLDNKGRLLLFNYSLVSAKRTKLVANQGSPLPAPAGKEILVVNLEIENKGKSPILINSQDFVRLIGENNKLYAPEFYNNPLEVQAISVRKDEVGFLVAEGQKQTKLQVGEIEKDQKDIVDVNF